MAPAACAPVTRRLRRLAGRGLDPGGIALAGAVDTFTIQWRFALPMLPIGGVLYYLAWKYCVGFLNEELGIA